MDFLRIPPPLRLSILAARTSPTVGSQSWRRLTTSAVPSSPIMLPELDFSRLGSYAQTHAPTSAQLRYAQHFFASSAAKGSSMFLWAAPTFSLYPACDLPEVAFFGRSNVGKSSLINALLFGHVSSPDKLPNGAARVSKKAGRTKTLNGFGVLSPSYQLGPPATKRHSYPWKRFPLKGGLVVVDLPGYGKASQSAWGREIMKYLTKRQQLTKAYVLVDAEHGLKVTDLVLLKELRRLRIVHSVVLTKSDKLLKPHLITYLDQQALSKRLDELKAIRESMIQEIDQAAEDGRTNITDLLCCSAQCGFDRHDKTKIGLDSLRWSILGACGFESEFQRLSEARRTHESTAMI